MSTHTIVTPSGPKTRPCNDRCGDGWHAYLAFIPVPYDAMTATGIFTLVQTLDRLNPAIEIGEVEAAPDEAPYPDAPEEARYGWALYYRDRPADDPAPDRDDDADTTELHIVLVDPGGDAPDAPILADLADFLRARNEEG